MSLQNLSFQVWALLSALFAGMTAVLAKKGIEGVPSNLAMAVRVVVILIFSVTIAYVTDRSKLSSLNSRALLFLTLSGFATGASWLCYFRALQLGPVSQVQPIDKLSFVIALILGVIFLHERPSSNVLCGVVLIALGVLLTLKK